MSKRDLYRGKNFEYRIVYKARDAGLEAERVGRSGAGDEKGDVIISGKRYECKYRSNGLKTLYKLYEKARDDKCNIVNINGFSVINVDDFLGSKNGKCKYFNDVRGSQTGFIRQRKAKLHSGGLVG